MEPDNLKLSAGHCGEFSPGHRFREIPAEHPPEQPAPGTSVWVSLLLALPVFSACYYPPYRAEPRPAPEVTGASRSLPSTQVFFYPMRGQTTEQQSRDHYDCYDWAIKQTGFDPGQSTIPTDQRVRVVPMPPPGHDTAALTIAGAVLGALIGGRRHAAGGSPDRCRRGSRRRRRIGFGEAGVRPADGGGLFGAGQGPRRPA
ncbi:MAG: hypothetical protein ACYDAA_14575 [Syntrophales bacterium]